MYVLNLPFTFAHLSGTNSVCHVSSPPPASEDSSTFPSWALLRNQDESDRSRTNTMKDCRIKQKWKKMMFVGGKKAKTLSYFEITIFIYGLCNFELLLWDFNKFMDLNPHNSWERATLN